MLFLLELFFADARVFLCGPPKYDGSPKHLGVTFTVCKPDDVIQKLPGGGYSEALAATNEISENT